MTKYDESIILGARAIPLSWWQTVLHIHYIDTCFSYPIHWLPLSTLNATANMVSKVITQWSPQTVLVEVFSFILIITSPLLVLFYWICYQFFNSSISSTAFTAYSEGIYSSWASGCHLLTWSQFWHMVYGQCSKRCCTNSFPDSYCWVSRRLQENGSLIGSMDFLLGDWHWYRCWFTLDWIGSFDVHCRTLGRTCLDRKYIQSGHAYYLPCEGLLLAR